MTFEEWWEETGSAQWTGVTTIADMRAAFNAGRAEATKAKDQAYLERNQLVAALAWLMLEEGGTAGLRPHEPDPDPTWSDDWKNVVIIDLPAGQVSWHYHDSHRPIFEGLPPYPGKWDGHDTTEKYRRLHALAPGKPDDK